MKSSSIISYQGKVTLKIMHGKKIVQTIENHNEGTLHLMKFLTHCLGSNYDETLAPKYIMAYHLEGEGMSGVTDVTTNVTVRPVATNFSPSFNEVEDPLTPKNSKASVTLTFLLPSTLLNSTKTINRLAIYSSNDLSPTSYLAWIEVSPEIELSVGESVLVLWEMTLQNVDVPVAATRRVVPHKASKEDEEEPSENLSK